MFDKFKKEEGGEMVEEKPEKDTKVESKERETMAESSFSENSSEIGIGDLMAKRAKLDEAIDYVGLMIKNLKDKRILRI
jgi:hypothetical protein